MPTTILAPGRRKNKIRYALVDLPYSTLKSFTKDLGVDK